MKEDTFFLKTAWEISVEDGAQRLTLRRLRAESKAATERRISERRKQYVEDFESAWKQRTIQERKRYGSPDYNKVLTLEEYARLYVINLGTWISFVFWRSVRPRPYLRGLSIEPKETANGSRR